MDIKNKIRVIFVPSWRSGNPYQDLLAFSLRRRGVSIIISNYELSWPVLFKTIRANSPCGIIHLHWIKPYMDWFLSSDKGLKRFILYLMCFIDIFLVKLSGTKIVWTVHNKFTHSLKDIFWEKRIRRMLVLCSDLVIFHSASAVRCVKDSYGLKVFSNHSIIPHGHYIDVYPNDIERNRSREILGIGINSTVFLYFGSIKSYKGVTNLVNIFRNNHRLSNTILLIAGNPVSLELSDEILRLSSGTPNIMVNLKFIPREKVQIYMNAADICIFPFQDILTSGSVILAMSFGKAVVVPQKGCLSDLLDKQGAVFFESEDVLGTALEECLQADFVSMGAYNKKVIRQYNWDKIGEDTQKAYNNLKKRIRNY